MAPALLIDQLAVRRGRQSVLQDVSLTIRGAGLVGLVGPNGGGKSTLLAVITGLLAPTAGRITVMGLKPAKAAPQLGFVPQAARFDRAFPITLRGLVETGQLGPGLWRRQGSAAMAERALDDVGVAHLAGRPLSALSGGELQRGLIARALALSPGMLLLDEPTASVDADHSARLFDLLCDLARRIPVVVVSHDLAQIAAHADRVYCVNGRLWPAARHDSAAALAGEIFKDPADCRHRVPA